MIVKGKVRLLELADFAQYEVCHILPLDSQSATSPTAALHVVRIGRADDEPLLVYCRQNLLMVAAMRGWLRMDKGVPATT